MWPRYCSLGLGLIGALLLPLWLGSSDPVCWGGGLFPLVWAPLVWEGGAGGQSCGFLSGQRGEVPGPFAPQSAVVTAAAAAGKLELCALACTAARFSEACQSLPEQKAETGGWTCAVPCVSPPLCVLVHPPLDGQVCGNLQCIRQRYLCCIVDV